MILSFIRPTCALYSYKQVTTQPAGAVHNAEFVQHNTGKLQPTCDNCIQDRTAFNFIYNNRYVILTLYVNTFPRILQLKEIIPKSFGN